jgi:hypothetical protein
MASGRGRISGVPSMLERKVFVSLPPMVGASRKKGKEAEVDITKQNTRVLLGFRNAYAFDISQTNGVELPAMNEAGGDPGENIARLIAFLKTINIAVAYNEKIAPATRLLQPT